MLIAIGAICIIGVIVGAAYFFGYENSSEKLLAANKGYLETIARQKEGIESLRRENVELIEMNESRNLDLAASDNKILDLTSEIEQLKAANAELSNKLKNTEKMAGASKALIRSFEKEVLSLKDQVSDKIETTKRKYTRKRKPVAKK
jgi:predicted RNase H-like nuclease (RuvC/YqgF family)